MEAFYSKQESNILAPILLSAGFPIPKEPSHVFDFQKAILSLQKTLEYAIQQNHSHETTHVILDRGSIDGAAFWPQGMDHFFKTFYLDYEFELSRYDHLLFTRLPNKENYGTSDLLRFHNFEQSQETEIKLQTLWSQHASYTEIAPETDFQNKIENAVLEVLKIIETDRLNKTSIG